MADPIWSFPDHLSKYMGIFHNVQNDPYTYDISVQGCGASQKLLTQ
jgi:hypothetical protein